MCLTLVSCEDDIGAQAEEAIKDFDHELPQKESDVTVHFYIIGDKYDEQHPDGSHESAHNTIGSAFDAAVKARYNTNVKLHYINHDEYEQTVKQDLEKYKAGESDKNVFLLLINSVSLYEEIKSMDVLANLGTFINSSSYNYDYEVLKETLASVLSAAADEGNYYVLPNNNAYGKYSYFTLNKTVAKEYAVIESADKAKTADDIKALAAEFIEACKKRDPEISNTDLIAKINGFIGHSSSITEEDLDSLNLAPLSGHYGDVADAQKNDNYTVVTSTPKATAEDVYSSAYAVAGDAALAERAMRILYAINEDAYCRNILQYGVENIHYTTKEVDGVTTVTPRYSTESAATNTGVYKMSLKYTGNLYNAYNCADACLLCTYENPCDGAHVTWTCDNKVTCKTRIEYELNGGKWSTDSFKPLTGITNTLLELENYVPVRDSETVVEEDGSKYEITYEFAGWYKNPIVHTDDTVIKGVSFEDEGTVKLYAKWNEVKTLIEAPSAPAETQE